MLRQQQTSNTMTVDEINTVLWMSGLSGREFGELLGVSKMTVNRWERGQVAPRAESVAAMRRLKGLILGLSDAELHAHFVDLPLNPEPVKLYRRLLGQIEAGSGA
jgi:transcriptional regulator with XRE-family HTH domain